MPVTNNFTKTTLVDQVIEYWKNTENGGSLSSGGSSSHSGAENLSVPAHHTIPAAPAKSEDFPINVMSRNFSKWFFENLNLNSIQLNDFWNDCSCTVRMVDNAGEIKEDATITARLVLSLLSNIRNQFNFYFNPNVTHDGVQGRIELHGLVLILCCGTLHNQENCVGVFESVFGLLRDPFSDNNWKIKNIKLELKSSTRTSKVPQLASSSSLQQFMILPENDTNL